MVLVSLIWMQSQPLSKTVIVVASLLFILAICLLVYFVRKLRANSKRDEDWSLTRSSLFVEPAADEPVTNTTEGAEAVAASEPGETRLLASDVLEAEPLATATPPQTSEAPPATELLATVEPPPPARDERATQLFSSPPPREERRTEVLSSYRPEPIPAPEEVVADAAAVDAAAVDEATPFDEEVWAGLDEAQPPATREATRELRSPAAPLVPPQADAQEPLREARVEQRAPQASFEPPAIEPLRPPREPFEPPVINPITPREQTALLGKRPDAAQSGRDLYSSDEAKRPAATESNLHHELNEPTPTTPLYSDRAASREHGIDIGPPQPPESNPAAADQAWDAGALAQANRARSAHKPAGAVLGLPMEMSQSPLVLGTPARSREEIGIGSLTGYGKVDREGGRGGLVVLLVALLVFGGATAAYLLVPSVHERVNSWIARARGLDPNEQISAQPKAMIFPSRVPETDKNTVHAKGAVQNISNDTLENLTLDVQLNKSSGEVETLSIAVTPSQLAPNEQGAYAFDYDGKGINSYTIKRLLINGKEARFTAPGQK
jgi:hypothetical protein